MYCPKCAATVTAEQRYCRSCGLDLQLISQVFEIESGEMEPARRRKKRLANRGVITLMTGLMIGCLIPICLGLLHDWDSLIPLILVLSGLAGLALFAGVTILVYSDSLKGSKKSDQPEPLPTGVPTNQLPPVDQSASVASVTERTTDLLDAPAAKGSRESG